MSAAARSILIAVVLLLLTRFAQLSTLNPPSPTAFSNLMVKAATSSYHRTASMT